MTVRPIGLGQMGLSGPSDPQCLPQKLLWQKTYQARGRCPAHSCLAVQLSATSLSSVKKDCAPAPQDVKSHNELDSSFEKLRLAIVQHVSLLQRQAQVRVKNWLKKLAEEVRCRGSWVVETQAWRGVYECLGTCCGARL